MNRGTPSEISLAARADGAVIGVMDVERLGTWVRFEATITEGDSARGLPPVVSELRATDDDGAVVPIGLSEHASIVLVFLQAYYRWRRGRGSSFGHG